MQRRGRPSAFVFVQNFPDFDDFPDFDFVFLIKYFGEIKVDNRFYLPQSFKIPENKIIKISLINPILNKDKGRRPSPPH